MAFDSSSAVLEKPAGFDASTAVAESGGFDPASAQPDASPAAASAPESVSPSSAIAPEEFWKGGQPAENLSSFITPASAPDAMQPAGGEPLPQLSGFQAEQRAKANAAGVPAYDQPAFFIPKPEITSIGSGFVNSLATAAESLTSPLNIGLIASLGGAPTAIQRAAAVGFGSMMAVQAERSIREGLATNDLGQKAKHFTDAVTSSAMAMLGGKAGFESAHPALQQAATDAAKKVVDEEWRGGGSEPIAEIAPQAAQALRETASQPVPVKPPASGKAEPSVAAQKEPAVAAVPPVEEAPAGRPSEITPTKVAPDHDPENVGQRELIRRRTEQGATREEAIQEISDTINRARKWHDNLPTGSVIRDKQTGREFTKESDGTFRDKSGNVMSGAGTGSELVSKSQAARTNVTPDVLTEDVKTEKVKTPPVKPPEPKPDLFGGSEELHLRGEKIIEEAPKPKEKLLTVQETVSEAVAAYGDAASAHEHLGKQIEALSADKKNKPTVDRLRAAQRKIENVLEEEHRRSEQAAQDEKMGQQHHELVQSVKDLGGLPVLGGKGKYATGELGRIIESSKGAFLGLFRKGAKSLDTLRENLADRGFSFETPYDMLTAIEDSIRSVKKRYGTEFPPDYRGGPGAMGPEEAAQMEAERKIFQTAHEPIQLRRVEEERGDRKEWLRRSDQSRMDEAEATIESDPKAASRLVDQILDGTKKVIDDKEELMLGREMIDLEAARDAAAERAGDPDLSLAERQQHALESDAAMERLMKTWDAADLTGSEKGAAFRMRRQMIADDYSLRGLSRKAKKDKAKRGEEGGLSSEEIEGMRKQADEIAEAQRQADAAEEKNRKANEDAELDATVEVHVRELEQAAKSGETYHPRVMEHARAIVDRAQKAADESWKEIRRMFGSESGGVGGVGGGKGEGKKMGSAANQSLIKHVANVLKAKVYKFGLTMAEAADAMLLEGDDIADRIRPILHKAVAKANSMIDRELSLQPPKVREAVKTGAKGEKTKRTPTKDEIIGRGRAAVAKGEGMHDVVAEIVNGMIESGRRDRAEIMADAHKIVQEFMPEATERDVRRAYIEYGKKTYPNPDEIAAFKRKTRQAVKIEEDIARIENEKLRPGLQGYQRDKLDLELRDLVKRRSELLKDPSLPPEPGAFASKDEAKQTRIKNRIEELDRYLKEGVKSPEAKPTAQDSPKTEQLRAEKEVLEAYVKEVDAAKNPPLSEAQKALDSAMVARERAAQTLDDISTGKLKPDSPKAKEALTQLEEDVRMETDAMKQLAAEMRRDAKPKGDPGYAKEQAQIKALEKAIDRYAEKTAAGDFTTTGKKLGPDSRRVAQLKEIRDSRRSMYQTARDAGKPVRSPEERYNDTRMKALTKREEELKERLRTGNFAPKPKPVTPKLRKDVLTAKARVEELKREVDMKAREEMLRQRPLWKKALSQLNQVRGVILGSDIGVLTRQGLFSWSRPVTAIRATRTALKAALSPEAMGRWEVEMRERQINGEAVLTKEKAAGLQITDTMTHPEELVVTRLLSRIPDFNVGGKTVRLSAVGRTLERFQTTFINAARRGMFDSAVKQGMNPTELKLRANFINSVTGRSNVKYVPQAMQAIFTSPRYEISRWETLAQPVRNIGALARDGVKGELNKAALANLQDMAVTAGGILALFMVAQKVGGYQVNWNPTSTDFLKMRKGDDVWDVSAGLAPRIRDVMRMYVAYTHPDYKHNIGKVLLNMGMRTLNPAITTAIDQSGLALQKRRGDKVPKLPLSGFRSDDERDGLIALAPLIVQSTKQALDAEGTGSAAFTAAREFVGSSVNRYPAPKEQSTPRFTDPALKSALRIPR